MTSAITHRSAAALAVFAILCTSTHRAPADDLEAIQPNRREIRELYSLLQQDWWNWAASLPAEDHPLADKTGENCDAGQDEDSDVFFLGGTFAEVVSGTKSVGVADRVCVVPEGKYLFFPIINLIFTNIGEDPPLSDAELEAAIAFFNSTAAQDLKLELDGVEVRGVQQRFESESGAFELNYVEDGIFGEDGGSTRAADAGFYVLLEPLTPGIHEIEFEGSYVFTVEEHGFDFETEQNIRYTIMVE
jgi:hypothetical protein